MNALDIILFIVLIYGIVKGIIRGFILQISSFFGVILGIYIAKLYVGEMSLLLNEWIDVSVKYARPMAYFILFCCVILLCHMLAKLLDKTVTLPLMDSLNKFLGGFIGLLKYAFVLSIFLNVFQVIDSKVNMIKQEKKDASLLYNPIKVMVPTIMPFVNTDDFEKK